MMYRLITILIVLLYWSNPADSQLRKSYGLKGNLQLLTEEKPDTATVLALQKKGNFYLHKNPVRQLDSAAYYFRKASLLLTKIPDAPLKYTISELSGRAELEDKKNNLPGAWKLMMEAVRQQKLHPDKNAEADIWFTTGIMLYMQEKYIVHAKRIDSIMLIAYNLYRQTKNIAKQVQVKYWMFEILMSSGQGLKSEQMALKMLNDYRKTPVAYFPDLYALVAKSNRYRGNYNRSLYYALKSVEMMATTGDYTREGTYYGEMAEVYQELGQMENSVKWYRKTILAREKTNIPQRYLFRTAGFLAHELILLKRPREALHEVLALEKRHKPDNNVDIGTLSQIKAYCYEAMGYSKLAEYHYRKMLRLYDKNVMDELTTLANLDIANFYINQGRYKEAEPHLLGLDTQRALVSKKKDIELLMFRTDSAAGRYLPAIKHLRKYERLKDSIFSSEKSKQIEEIQIRYQTARNEQSIKLLKKDSLLSAARLKDADRLRNMTLLGLLVLIVFLALLYYSYRLKQRSNVEINKKNLSLNKLVQEKEWLIREVHHRVKNNLQIVMGLLQRQSAYIDNDKARMAIQNSEHRMHSIALIHQKLYQTESMARINMPEYIDELINYLKDSFDTGSRIHFHKEIENFSLNVQHAVPLGLILNEAITNAIKYAFGPNENGDIHVVIIPEGETHFMLLISDNGNGLPPGFSLNQINSMGMNLMKGLCKQLGGKLKIEGDQGVTVQVIFKRDKLIPPNRRNTQQESYG